MGNAFVAGLKNEAPRGRDVTNEDRNSEASQRGTQRDAEGSEFSYNITTSTFFIELFWCQRSCRLHSLIHVFYICSYGAHFCSQISCQCPNWLQQHSFPDDFFMKFFVHFFSICTFVMPTSDSVLVISVCILSISVEIVPSSCSLKVSGLKTIRFLEHSFPWWNFRSQDHSFPGTFVPWTVRTWTIRSPIPNLKRWFHAQLLHAIGSNSCIGGWKNCTIILDLVSCAIIACNFCMQYAAIIAGFPTC